MYYIGYNIYIYIFFFTLNPQGNIYTAIHSKMLKKIKANKTMPKTTKTIKTGIS